jgi:Ca2+-binding RTX toxin-like protein
MAIIRVKSNSRSGEYRLTVGTAPAEQFEGGEGNDTFRGMGGSDIFRRGAGITTVDYSWAKSGIIVNLSKDFAQQTGGGGLNTLVGIRGIIGTAYADDIWGHNLADTLRGEGGNDVIHASLGNDVVDGGAGNDSLFGGDGDDTITGSAGDDILRGEAGKDVLDGGAGNDNILGGGGDDRLNGGDGDDLIGGGLGLDAINGGAGFDTLSYIDATRAVTIDRRDVSGRSNSNDAGGDTITSIEAYQLSNFADLFIAYGETVTVDGAGGDDRITGSGGRDVLRGGAGNDVLDGGRENDQLFGDDGNDILISGYGAADYMDGGRGADTYVFQSGGSAYPYPDRVIFSKRDGDKLDFSQIDPIPGGADNRFAIAAGTTVTAAGQIVFAKLDASTWQVLADTNGDRIADFAILVTTSETLTASDFIL